MKKLFLLPSVILMLSGVIFLGAMNHASGDDAGKQLQVVQLGGDNAPSEVQLLALMNRPEFLAQLSQKIQPASDFQGAQMQTLLQTMMLKNIQATHDLISNLGKKDDKKDEKKKDDKPFYAAWKDDFVSGLKDGSLFMTKKVPGYIFYYAANGAIIYFSVRLIARMLPWWTGAPLVEKGMKEAIDIVLETFGRKIVQVPCDGVPFGPQMKPEASWFDWFYSTIPE